MRQFRDWQFTKGAIDPPQAYLDYVLCSKIYHCTPSELNDQDALTVDLHVQFWSEEQKASKPKRLARGKRRRRG